LTRLILEWNTKNNRFPDYFSKLGVDAKFARCFDIANTKAKDLKKLSAKEKKALTIEKKRKIAAGEEAGAKKYHNEGAE
jgi:hypothetical protein